MALSGRWGLMGADQHVGDVVLVVEWAFPPRPDTHHVRWIACHPLEPERLWVAIEAGALVSTATGDAHGATGCLGDHGTPTNSRFTPAPDTFRVSAGDGYFESDDAGATWRSPNVGLEVGYLRSVAIDPEQPEVVVVSALSGPSPHTWPAARMAGCIAGSLASVGSGSTTAGRNQPHPRASALRRREASEACGPPTSAASTVPMPRRKGVPRVTMRRPPAPTRPRAGAVTPRHAAPPMQPSPSRLPTSEPAKTL